MIQKVLKRKLLPALLLSASLIVAAFVGDISGWDQQANIHKFKQFTSPASQEIVIIEIDDASINHFESWPWPRSRFAEFLYKVEQAKPKLVAFDLDFNSKTNLLDDQIFSDALKSVSFPVVLSSSSRISRNVNNFQMLQTKEVLPIEALAKYSLLANTNVIMEKTGMVIKYPTRGINNRPTIGALLANNLNTPQLPVQLDFSIDPLSIPFIPFKEIATDEFDFEEIRGKILLVGSTSMELSDMYTLPKHGRLPSVFIHALGFETLIADELFSTLPHLFMLLLALTLFITLAFSADDKRLTLALGGNLVIASIIYATSMLLHRYAMLMLPVTLLYLAILFSTILQIFQNIKYRTYILFKETNRNNYNKALVNQVIRESANGIIITNLAGEILVANRKARQLFSMDRQTVINQQSVFDFIPSSQKQFEKVSTQNISDKSKLEFMVEEITNKSGENFTIEMLLNKTSFVQYFDNHKFVFGGNKPKSHEIYSFTISDITEKVKIIAEKTHSENALINLKNNDQLTQLPNRVSFNKVLELLYSNTHIKKTSLVMLINLDSIKEINDIYGAEVGDDSIYQIAQKLKRLVRKQGLIARFSDKVFGVIYNDVNVNDEAIYTDLIRQIYAVFSQPLHLNGQSVLMEASMGIVFAPKHGDTPDMLINNATQALDYSKSSEDLDWFIYEEDLANKLRMKREIRSDLQRAIKNQEFILYYQAQHDIRTNALIGYEALIRWEDPYKGLRFPDEFIPVAEEFGLIAEIGELVLNIGCHDAVDWPGKQTVAINVSPVQFKNADMVALCEKYIAQSGLPAERLELEITESMMMDDVGNVIDTLSRLQKLGVKIAMDDFGTGYSSLQYLTELPFDKIKIDRSFTMNIGKSKQADALISTIVALGHSLDKLVLAEGIETEEMIILLKAAGCQIGQGYHYSRPMPAKDVRAQQAKIEKQKKSA
ncbi:MAG: EAL domain-containing protein [Hyphomicrobiales bacterium]